MIDFKYILDGHTPVPCPDIYKWAEWFETANRQVARTEYPEQNILISTVFTGLVQAGSFLLPDAEPILFETMVFGGDFDRYIRQYRSWRQAEVGHDIIRQMVEATLHKS